MCHGTLAILCLAACAREPIANCPELAVGDLVVTEVRGDGDESNGSWLELFNASGVSIDLAGMRFRFRRQDGSGEARALVRRAMTVSADEYVVLGRHLDTMRPAHVDYGFLDDYDIGWLAAAAIEVEACGRTIDSARYDALPATGTYALGVAPDAEINDLPASWCSDPNADGSPGAANPPCP